MSGLIDAIKEAHLEIEAEINIKGEYRVVVGAHVALSDSRQ